MTRVDADASDLSTSGRPPPTLATCLLVVDERSHVVHKLPEHGARIIGRGRDADLRVEHASVSRRHARIHLGTALQLEDLGSANGTFIDGRRLASGQTVPLPLGAIAQLGELRLVAFRERSGAGDAMDRVRKLVDRIAASDISVIIVGETGAGKEVLAEEIHRRSKRANGPFVRLNCAAVPEMLLETELFGHERGAFTGALQTKLGLVEAADGGTLLLDEIGELGAGAQAKLLRVIETREIVRVGAVRPRAIDVRFLAATHRDLEVMVALGQFRQDLVFRLNGLTVQLPPLRERALEIVSIAESILSLAARRAGRPPMTIAESTQRLLESYRWPGNVRELRNAIERALLLCDGTTLQPEHVVLSTPTAAAHAPPVSAPPPPPAAGALELGGDERERITKALDHCAGNQTEAARLLGITRRMLLYRIDKLNLPRPRKGAR